MLFLNAIYMALCASFVTAQLVERAGSWGALKAKRAQPKATSGGLPSFSFSTYSAPKPTLTLSSSSKRSSSTASSLKVIGSSVTAAPITSHSSSALITLSAHVISLPYYGNSSTTLTKYQPGPPSHTSTHKPHHGKPHHGGFPYWGW